MRIVSTNPAELMPGLTVRNTSRDVVVVDLGFDADPVNVTPEVLNQERRRLGCKLLPDGTWRDSWKFRKEYMRDYMSQQGQPAFEASALDWQLGNVRVPVDLMDVDGSGELVSHPAGRLRIYGQPWAQPWTPEGRPEAVDHVVRACGIGMDVSEGVAASDSTIQVFFADTREQAAEFNSNTISPGDLGRFAVAVAKYYNQGLICCVRKMHGLTALRVMCDELRYPFLWHHRVHDRIVERHAPNLGWARGEGSDDLLFGTWIDAVEHRRVILRSKTCLDQHREYFFDDRGLIVHRRISHLSPQERLRHGDLVIGCTLAEQACRDLPRFRSIRLRRMTHIERELHRRRQAAKSPWRR